MKFYSVAEGSLIRSVDVGAGPIYSVRLNPAGTVAVINAADQTLRTVEVASGLVTIIEQEAGYSTGMEFSTDGRWMSVLMNAPAPGRIVLMDARRWKPVRRLDGHDSGATCAVFSPDGSALASVGGDGSVKLWECHSGRLLSTPVADLRGMARLRFSRNSRSLYVVSDASVRVIGRPGDSVPAPNPTPPRIRDRGLDDMPEFDDLDND